MAQRVNPASTARVDKRGPLTVAVPEESVLVGYLLAQALNPRVCWREAAAKRCIGAEVPATNRLITCMSVGGCSKAGA
jgi:hypothetical protein